MGRYRVGGRGWSGVRVKPRGGLRMLSPNPRHPLICSQPRRDDSLLPGTESPDCQLPKASRWQSGGHSVASFELKYGPMFRELPPKARGYRQRREGIFER